MDMNKAFFLKAETKTERWQVLDAEGQVIGRLATRIADILRGRNKVTYTPHADSGDYVVVINAEKMVFTGNKLKGKIYQRYTGWIGNMKEFTAEQMMDKDPGQVLHLAVKGMLPKTIQSRAQLRKLKVYAGTEHPHQGQVAATAATESVTMQELTGLNTAVKKTTRGAFGTAGVSGDAKKVAAKKKSVSAKVKAEPKKVIKKVTE
jgi:large subunit ribosomal protein L13